MAYTAVPTVATGDTWSATQHNTYLRDNMAAIWAGSAAGQMDYYTSATTKSNIATPASYAVLSHNGSVPSWAAGIGMSTRAYRSSGTTWVKNTDISWNANSQDTTWHSTSTNPTRVTVDLTGIYLISVGAYIQAIASGTTFYAVDIYINGSPIGITGISTVPATYNASILIPSARISLSAGDYITIRQLDGSVSGAITLLSGSFLNVVKIK